MKIILDTNIWYSIAEDKYKNFDLFSYPLVLTAWNVVELYTSRKRANQTEKYKIINVAKKIKELNPIYLNLEPYNYVAKKIFGIKSTKEVNIALIDNLINDTFSETEINEAVNFRKARVNEFKKSVDEQQANYKKNKYRAELYSSTEETLNANLSSFLLEMKRVTECSEEFFNRQVIEKNGRDVNFYLYVRSIYCWKLDNIRGYGISKNDQGDLLNMLYVGYEDMYWTEDNKFLQNIIDAGLCDKVFSPIKTIIE